MATLSAEDRNRVEAAVMAAERTTAAELAVVVARVSDDYGGFPVLWGGVAALIAGGIVAVVWPATPATTLFAIQAVVFLLVTLGLLALPVRAWLAPPPMREARCQWMAEMQFAARVEQRTHDAVGLLLFVSLAEHFAEVRVDAKIAAAVPQATWEDIISAFVRAMRSGSLAPALIAAVDACAAVLAPHFPAVPGQVDEISNRVTEL